jgi:hypothetical protein
MEPKTDYDSFRESMKNNEPSLVLTPHAKALWYAGKGNWNKAHDIVQELPDNVASEIHAYLHRQEGDISNAEYWYSRAGSRMPSFGLNEEWESLVKKSLGF